MTVETRFFAWSSHVLPGKVASPPALCRIDVDVLWTTKAVHRVVHLDTFPSMIVVILIKDEVKAGPTRRKEGVVTLLMRHVDQLIDLAPVVPLEAAVEFRIAFQRWIFVNESAIGDSRPARA